MKSVKSSVPQAVADFLHPGNRIAVAGVSRDTRQPANAIFRKLRDAGYEVVPVNPSAPAIGLEGAECYPDLRSVPGPIDGVVVVTHPSVAVEAVRQCAARGDVKSIWFHRSIGSGSLSQDALAECKARNISCIAGGCPMMYCEPVDPAHRCMKSVLRFLGRIPG